VKRRAIAVTGAIEAWAISERIAHREKSLEPELAWSLDSSKTIASMGMVRKYNLHVSQGVLFT
jgi:hypothetical protein